MFHRTGMGFRGFQQIETEDMVNDRTMTSTYDIELLGSELEKSTPTDTIKRIYDLKRESNRIALLTLKQETTENVLNETTTIGKYEYNDYGQDTALFRFVRTLYRTGNVQLPERR